ncbi:hypothetical protein OE88DRAFT_1733391 [Heliocybe sulcata]|uniref:Uncharacterized protein n=1 Tax=Heliocybe sulcata TaxID=5364 RepID=A0A5C3NIP7_9AGAM|nr:hypothetical protein OE88DRAFT_1733391 [Heliocybe sulcata]
MSNVYSVAVIADNVPIIRWNTDVSNVDVELRIPRYLLDEHDYVAIILKKDDKTSRGEMLEMPSSSPESLCLNLEDVAKPEVASEKLLQTSSPAASISCPSSPGDLPMFPSSMESGCSTYSAYVRCYNKYPEPDEFLGDQSMTEANLEEHNRRA